MMQVWDAFGLALFIIGAATVLALIPITVGVIVAFLIMSRADP